ncbi:hypothetical protein O6H91_11G032800 [Diphasiastrum complanatum]|uniref:Uncharacterized protein n=1 Tax=Diphasiastrum complanatum TaxID=34168 RepID=A0ACC2C7Z1_DIPCM|nr:hypothetical protein O6H91_11G032800 [Diphasiastrum complanatum]
MLLRASTAASSSVGFCSPCGDAGSRANDSESSIRCRASFGAARGNRPRLLAAARRGVVRAAESAEAEATVLTGVLFEPFQEIVKNPLVQVPLSTSQSLARQRYASACEAGVNEQINVEYSVSYIYHALFAYFDRDNVALPGMAHFFKESSEEEREHAEKLMKYQNIRGGRVYLHSILQPASFEFDHPEKGDALYAMELALSLEKLTNEKLLALHKVADENGDPQLQDFIESEYLQEQVESIKKISEYVSQLRRVGKGHGVYHFDLVLQKENGNGKEVL